MKRIIFAAMLLALAQASFALTADEVTDAVDRNLTFNEGEMDISMHDYKQGRLIKELYAHIVFKKDKGTLMTFTRPPRERNKQILLIKDNMWMSVPGVSRPVRLSGKDSFMGTSFSNRDLMDYDMHNDYKSAILEENDREYKLELVATNRNVPYPRIVMWVEKKNLLPTRQELYALSGNLIKTMAFTDVKDLGGKLRPALMTVRDVLTQGNETRVLFESMENKPVNESVFSPQRLGK
jgi:outer membrane lipoprotein-sorting protein